MIVAPSILSANFAQLQSVIQMLEKSEADWIHCDVMDGHFVPNITFGMPIIAAIRPLTTKIIDVHLMIEKPERYIGAFAKAGADCISVHLEACTHLDRTLHQIKALGCKAGVAINPSTPVSALQHVLYCTDYVCLLSVNPGFGGQPFIEEALKKIAQLRNLIQEGAYNTLIEVDGGITPENVHAVVEAGADIVVAGSAVFRAQNPEEVIRQLKSPKYARP